MTDARPDPVLFPAPPEMVAAARALLAAARHAALSYLDPATGLPAISRIALGTGADGVPLTLVSQLSAHHAGLVANPACALMVGEPGAKGDPLSHPRLMVQARAVPVPKAPLRDGWLRDHPKAAVYIDFADFGFFRLEPAGALWNGGFGRAARLTPADLGPSA